MVGNDRLIILTWGVLKVGRQGILGQYRKDPVMGHRASFDFMEVKNCRFAPFTLTRRGSYISTQNDVLDILRKFDLRPKTVKANEFIAEVSFKKIPTSTSDRDADAFNLEIGNTLQAYGTFVDYPLNARFYATGDLADWFEQIEEDKTYKLKIQCLFELDTEVEFTKKGPITWKAGRKGLLVKLVEEEGPQYGYR